MFVRRMLLVLCMVILAVHAATMFAALRVYDGFDYVASGSPGSLNDQNGGFGWTTPWTGALYQVVEPGLSYVDLAVTGNAMTRFSWPQIVRHTSFTLNDGETAWLSVLAYCEDGNTSSGAWLKLGTGNALSVGHTYNLNWRIVDWDHWGDTGIPVVSGQTVFLVVRMQKNSGANNDSVWMWVNPSLLAEPQTNAANQAHLGNFNDIDTSRVEVQMDHQMWFDEIRIGDTWEDVMPRVIYVGSPDIALYEDDVLIPNNVGNVYFGTLSGSSTAQKTIIITNLGDATLFLTASNTPVVAIEGNGAAYFSVITEPATNIPAGGATTFTVRFDPPDTGDGSAMPQLIIANNDPDEAPYTITLHGGWNNSFYAYEPFEYDPGTQLNNQNGGQGFGGAWNSSGYLIGTDNLTYDLLEVNGHHVERGGTFFASTRNLAATFGLPGQTVWVSYVTMPLTNGVEQINDPVINSNLFFYFQLRHGTTVRLQSGKRTTHVNYQMDSQGIYGTTAVPVGSEPAFIVHRIIYGAGQNRVDMWVNPTLGETEPGLPADQTLTTSSNMAFNAIGLFATGGARAREYVRILLPRLGRNSCRYHVGTGRAGRPRAGCSIAGRGAAYCALHPALIARMKTS